MTKRHQKDLLNGSLSACDDQIRFHANYLAISEDASEPCLMSSLIIIQPTNMWWDTGSEWLTWERGTDHKHCFATEGRCLSIVVAMHLSPRENLHAFEIWQVRVMVGSHTADNSIELLGSLNLYISQTLLNDAPLLGLAFHAQIQFLTRCRRWGITAKETESIL